MQKGGALTFSRPLLEFVFVTLFSLTKASAHMHTHTHSAHTGNILVHFLMLSDLKEQFDILGRVGVLVWRVGREDQWRSLICRLKMKVEPAVSNLCLA